MGKWRIFFQHKIELQHEITMHREVPYNAEAATKYAEQQCTISVMIVRGAAIRRELQRACAQRKAYAQYASARATLQSCEEFAAALAPAEAAFQRHVDAIEETIAVLTVKSTKCAGKMRAAELRSAELHAAAQLHSMADLPADLYSMIFRFQHRTVCRRLLRWSQEQRQCMLVRPPGRTQYDLEVARRFLSQYPTAIFSPANCIPIISERIGHKYVLVENLHDYSGAQIKGTTHIVCTAATLPVLNHSGATDVEYVQVLPRGGGRRGTILNARPLRMTQQSYEHCLSAGYTFAAGVEIVAYCEINYVPPPAAGDIVQQFKDWCSKNSVPDPEPTLRGRYGRGN